MKKILILFLSFCLTVSTHATNISISSPDKNLVINVFLNPQGSVNYNAKYKDKIIIEDSPLGIITNISDFSKNLKLVDNKEVLIDKKYTQDRIKKSEIHYVANEIICLYENPKKEKLSIVFRVSNNNIAIKYQLAQNGETSRCIIEKELTGFRFPSFTTTFLTPQATPMIGWKKQNQAMRKNMYLMSL